MGFSLGCRSRRRKRRGCRRRRRLLKRLGLRRRLGLHRRLGLWGCIGRIHKVPPRPKERPCHSARVKLGQGSKRRKRSDSAGDSTSGLRPGPRAVPSTSGPRTRHRRDLFRGQGPSSKARTGSDGLTRRAATTERQTARQNANRAPGCQAAHQQAAHQDDATTERETINRTPGCPTSAQRRRPNVKPPTGQRVRPLSRRPPCGRIRRRPLGPRCTSGGSR